MQPKNPAALRQHLNLGKTPSFRFLVQERRECRDKTQRANLSKQIRKHVRANMRQKRNKRLNDILAEFRDLGNIATINEDPVRHQTKLNRAEPSKEDFTTTLSAIFLLTRIEYRLLRLILVLHHSQVLSHLPWQKWKMQCSKCDVVVVQTEMVWCWNCLNMALLVYMYVWCACTMKYYAQDSFDSFWRHTLFTMVPKSGDLQQTKNWRPIAILKITYKIFAKMLHDRLQPLLETEQSMDQVGSRRGTGIDHALAVFEISLW